MNNTTSTSSSYLLTTEQWCQYVIFYLIFGIIGTAGNCLIFYLIIIDKKLHTFFYMLLAGHSFGRAIYSLQCVNLGVYHIVADYLWNTIMINRLQCHLIHFFTYFCTAYTSVTMLLLAADRTYSLGKPLSYRKHTVKQGILTVLVSIAITIATKMLPSYAGSMSFSAWLLCSTAQAAVTTEWWNYNYYTNFLSVLASVIMYIVLFVVAFIRKRSLTHGSRAHDELTNKIIKRQLILLDSIRLLIIVNVLTVLPFNILQIVSGYLPVSVRSSIITYGASFSLADRLVDPFILIWKSSDIYKSFRLRFGKPNTITIASKVQSFLA